MAKQVLVYHAYYGCMTGCCGHAVRFDDHEDYDREGFTFDHPWNNDDLLEFAQDVIRKELGPDHIKDLDWEHSEVITIENCPM